MTEIYLTHRALEDIQEIYDYSVKEWGKGVADKYLDEIQTVLILLQENPGLLKIIAQISNRFKAYPLKGIGLSATSLTVTFMFLQSDMLA